MRPFHLAFPVHDLAEARHFYGEVIGCREGRSSEAWVDFDFFGHQVVAHLTSARSDAIVSHVDGHGVPVPHFGIIMKPTDWHALRARFEAAGVDFGVPPHIRFEGQPGEQATMFVRDPSGNALEFKAFGSDEDIFAT